MDKPCKTCGLKNYNGAKKCKGCGSPFFVQKIRDFENKAKDILK